MVRKWFPRRRAADDAPFGVEGAGSICTPHAAVSGRQGRGRRETALRSARALADRPISASSAAACTAVPRSAPRSPGGGATRFALGRGREVGRAADAAAGRAADVAAGRAAGVAAGRAAGFAAADAAFAPLAFADAVLARADGLAPVGFARRGFAARAEAVAAAAGEAAETFLAAGAAAGEVAAVASAAAIDGSPPSVPARTGRLALRRCGRVCGRPPRTSEGGRSLIAPSSRTARSSSSRAVAPGTGGRGPACR